MINFTEKYESLELVSKDKSKLTYTAINIETKEKVILKLYEKSQYKESKFDELKKIVQFSNINENENLLKINNVDSGCYMDTIYYIVEMEYTEYETLEKILENKDFTENEALGIIKQVINGLHDLHRLNIVYKNLSTEKIYINEDNIIKLDSIGYIDKYPKTIKYISPEQVANKSINKTSDIYSLGIVLFEIINKKLPFVWENGKKELYKSMMEEFYIDKEKCSLNVISILENCLYIDPKDRYENLDAFLLDISSHLDYNIRTFRNDIELEKQAKERMIEAKLKAIANMEKSKSIEVENNKDDNNIEENNNINENNKNIDSNETINENNIKESGKNEDDNEEFKEVKNLKNEGTGKEEDRSKYKEYMKIVSACAAVGIVSATLKFAGSDIIEGLKNKDNVPNTTISNQNKPTGYTNKTRDKVNQQNTNATQENNTNTNTDNSEYTHKKYNPIEIEDVEIDNTLNTDNEQNKNEGDTNTSQPSQDNNTENNTQQKPEQKPEVTPTPEQTPQQPEQKPEQTPTPEQTPQQPEQKPEVTPTPEQTPQQPEQTPEQTPNTPTDQSPIQEPQTTPEVTPQ
ncbi:protein kinase domain-containing protein [Romboutsia sp. 1001713B170207_170306_H8]|uniref:protein kinase domain-containing protein n=1 Tax=Romboutsia sp. 1001713B170207_170306_H8 TaxID=2787112 RepID=UPI00189920F2|nr:protein kinase [Romboutsia sp. 1001713B170207_170306_H8]